MDSFKAKDPYFPETYPLERAYPLYPANFSDTEKDVLPFRYQPGSIHTLEGEKDELLLSYYTTSCPITTNLTKNLTNSPGYDEIMKKFNSTIAELSKKLNVPASSLEALKDLGDTLIVNYFEGKPLPGEIDLNSGLGRNLTFLLNYMAYYLSTGTPLQRQLFSMNPQFKEDLEQILKGSKTVVQLYSAHDSTLVPVLAPMGIASHECLYKNFFENGNFTSCYFPKFASALRFEAWKNETDENSSEVRVYYDEVVQNICKSENGHCKWGAYKGFYPKYHTRKRDRLLQRDMCFRCTRSR